MCAPGGVRDPQTDRAGASVTGDVEDDLPDVEDDPVRGEILVGELGRTGAYGKLFFALGREVAPEEDLDRLWWQAVRNR